MLEDDSDAIGAPLLGFQVGERGAWLPDRREKEREDGRGPGRQSSDDHIGRSLKEVPPPARSLLQDGAGSFHIEVQDPEEDLRRQQAHASAAAAQEAEASASADSAGGAAAAGHGKGLEYVPLSGLSPYVDLLMEDAGEGLCLPACCTACWLKS